MRIEDAAERVGQKVVYRSPHMDRDKPGEEGVITSVNASYVFVRYGANTTSAATYPSDLEPIS